MGDAIPLRRSPVDLAVLLESVVALMRPQAEAMDVDLSLDIDPNAPASINVDADKVAWAISALIGTALRYVRRGSRVMPGGSVTVQAARAAEDLVLSVRDDGVGIPESVMADLFSRTENRPFYSALALGMVRDVAAAHGGRLDVTSRTDETDHGTVVRLRLPVA